MARHAVARRAQPHCIPRISAAGLGFLTVYIYDITFVVYVKLRNTFSIYRDNCQILLPDWHNPTIAKRHKSM